MMDFDYFTISWIIVYSMAVLIIPIFVVRLLRIFPFYVKNGYMGGDDNTILFATIISGKQSNPEGRRKVLRNFFLETHPGAILQDVFATAIIGFILFIAWIAIPPIAIGWFIFWCIIKLAKHMREQYVKKEEFVAKLDGTYEGES